MTTLTPTYTAIYAQFAVQGAAARHRAAILAADARLQRLRTAKAALASNTEDAEHFFARLTSGVGARSARISRLIGARIGQLDHDAPRARMMLREAAAARRTHWTMVRA